MALVLPKIDKTMPIVEFTIKDPKTGKWETYQGIITPQMQRFWQSAVIKTDDGSVIAGDKVSQVGITYVSQTISNPPTQAQVQAIDLALAQVVVALRN